MAAGLVRDARVQLRILERCSGRLEPGRLTLLLGAPASGKSTLLHALAGALHDGALKVGSGLPFSARGCRARDHGERATGQACSVQLLGMCWPHPCSLSSSHACCRRASKADLLLNARPSTV